MMKLKALAQFAPETGDRHDLPEMDALTESDALQEAQLLAVELDALAGSVSILLDLRVSLHFGAVDTAMIVARGVRGFHWNCPGRQPGLTAWSIGSSEVRNDPNGFRMSLSMWPSPGAQLEFVAASAEFLVGKVEGLSEAPPDFAEGDTALVRAGVPHWDSMFDLVAWSSIGQLPPGRPA
ncbi:hypothetical protein ROT00_00295 [Agromyces mediolanus]|uniref:hypothetical protein n=1 Tax=Agromyces mediolanus TaxID=41986 RepID=UPI003832CC5A